MDKSWWIGIGLAVFSAGLTAFLAKKMKPGRENFVAAAGAVAMLIGAAVFVLGIIIPESKQEEQKPSASSQQMNPSHSPNVFGGSPQFTYNLGVNPNDLVKPPDRYASVNIYQKDVTNSPNVFGDNSQVIINPDQSWRVTKTDEFIQTLRTAGPLAVRLEYLEDRHASLLYAQLYHLLVASKWMADKRAQVHTTPWTGVHVAVLDIHVAPPAAVKLVEQLQANGIASRLVDERNPDAFEGTAFIIKIGYRPLDNNE